MIGGSAGPASRAPKRNKQDCAFKIDQDQAWQPLPTRPNYPRKFSVLSGLRSDLRLVFWLCSFLTLYPIKVLYFFLR